MKKKIILCVGNSKLFARFSRHLKKIDKNIHLIIVGFSRNRNFFFKLKQAIRKKDFGQLTVSYETLPILKSTPIKEWPEEEIQDIALSMEWYKSAKGVDISPKTILGHTKFLFDKYKPTACLIFGDKLGRPFRFYSKAMQTSCINIELGYFRPETLQADMQGLNSECSIPKDVTFYSEYKGPTYCLPPANLHKENMIFLPFQMESDTQIFRNSPRFKTMSSYLEAVAKAVDEINKTQKNNPIKLLFKEHPLQNEDSYYRRELVDQIVKDFDFIEEVGQEASTASLIHRARLVAVINSTVGFEALMQQTPVITFGHAFYNVNGLVMKVNEDEDITSAFHKALDMHLSKKDLENFFGYVRYQHHKAFPFYENKDPALGNIFEYITQQL